MSDIFIAMSRYYIVSSSFFILHPHINFFFQIKFLSQDFLAREIKLRTLHVLGWHRTTEL